MSKIDNIQQKLVSFFNSGTINQIYIDGKKISSNEDVAKIVAIYTDKLKNKLLEDNLDESIDKKVKKEISEAVEAKILYFVAEEVKKQIAQICGNENEVNLTLKNVESSVQKIISTEITSILKEQDDIKKQIKEKKIITEKTRKKINLMDDNLKKTNKTVDTLRRRVKKLEDGDLEQQKKELAKWKKEKREKYIIALIKVTSILSMIFWLPLLAYFIFLLIPHPALAEFKIFCYSLFLNEFSSLSIEGIATMNFVILIITGVWFAFLLFILYFSFKRSPSSKGFFTPFIITILLDCMIGGFVFHSANINQCDYLISDNYVLHFLENEDECELNKISVLPFSNNEIIEITIPNEFHDKPITKIEKCTFDGFKNNQVSITFEEDSPLEYIDDFAFQDFKNLKSFSFPINFDLQGLGENVFDGCSSLEDITFPYIDSFIGKYFGASNYNHNNEYLPESLNTITILGGESIPDYAFYGCTNLENIYISGEVKNVGNNIFVNCTALTDLTIPFINHHMSYYFGAASYKDLNSVPNTLSSITILGGESIPSYAFYNFINLKSLGISSDIKIIGEDAFYGCSSLEKVNYCGFINQNLNGNVQQKINEAIDHWINIIFYNENSNPLYQNHSKLYVDNEIVETIELNNIPLIERIPFLGFDFVESIKITGESTIIEKNAFEDCRSLKELEIPYLDVPLNEYFGIKEDPSIIVVPSSLKSVSILGGDSLPDEAFLNLNFLNNITLSSNINYIGENAFEGCTSLERIDYKGTISNWANITFDTLSSNPLSIKGCKLYIDGKLPEHIIIEDINEIKPYAFYNCNYIESIIIKEGVTKIGEQAFYGCNAITTIEIPYSVADIEKEAFRECSSLNIVTFEEESKLKNLGVNAFYDCKMLQTIELPSGMESMGEKVFYGCNSLETLALPFVDTYLGYYFGSKDILYNSTKIPQTLKNIKILGGETIAEGAFFNCNSIETVEISEGIMHVGDMAFLFCNSVKTLVIPNSVLDVGVGGFLTLSQNLKNVYYKGTISQWANIDFGANASPMYNIFPTFDLSKITLDDLNKIDLYIDGTLFNSEHIVFDNIDRIGEGAFIYCDSIKSLTIPSSVKSIGANAFQLCNNLQRYDYDGTFSQWASIDFGSEADNPLFLKRLYINNELYSEDNIVLNGTDKIGSYAFANCNFIKSINIPNGVTSIGAHAFNNCSSLETIIIPSSVTDVGESLFTNCNKLKKVDFKGTISQWIKFNCNNTSDFNPLSQKKLYLNDILFNDSNIILNDIDQIGDCAFYNCDFIKSITIQDGITSIGEKAFSGCTSLETVTIPDSITSIESRAFENCASLKYVTYNGTILQWASIDFGDTQANPLSLGKLSIDGHTFQNNEIYIVGIEKIGSYAFANCDFLQKIIISDGTKSVGECAFLNCTSLSRVDLPNYLERIEDSAFYNCISLEDCDLERIFSLSYIGSQAFYNCSKLSSVTIHGIVEEIGSYAFYGCKSLENIKIYNGNKTLSRIGERAFDIENYPLIKKIDFRGTFSDWITTDFGDAKTNLLTSDKFYINGVVYKNTKNQDITLTNVHKIGSYAFANCDFVKSINILDGVTNIGEHAFENCDALETIVIPSSVKSIGANAFHNCKSLKKVDYKGNISQWASIDFGDADGNLLSSKKLYINNEIFQEENIVIEGVEQIGSYAFANCNFIKSVKITNGVCIINFEAFSGCSSLEYIIIPSSVIGIDNYSLNTNSNKLNIYLEYVNMPSLLILWQEYWVPSYGQVYLLNEWSYVNGIPAQNKQ